MLLGQRLGRRHQHRLEAGFERPQHRVERRPRSCPSRPRPSAAAASARRSRGRRRSRRRPRSWSPVGSNGSDSIQRPTSSPGLAEPRRRARGAVRALAGGQQRLVEEQLFEARAARSAASASSAALGEVGGRDRVADPGQAAAGAQLRRQRLDRVRRPARHACSAQSRIRCAFSASVAGMDRDEARAAGPSGRVLRARRPLGPRHPAATLVFVDPEAAFVERLPVSSSAAPGVSFVGHPGLVEPGRPDVAALVADFDAEDREAAAAEGARLAAEHLDQDRSPAARARGSASGCDLCGRGGCGGSGRAGRRRCAMPASAAASASFGPTPSRACERDVEGARARPVDGGVAQLARGSAREAPAKDAHYWAASSHHQLGWPPSWVSISTPSGTWVSISSSGDRRPLAGDHGDDLGPLGEAAGSSSPGSSRRRPRRRSRRRRSRPRRPC